VIKEIRASFYSEIQIGFIVRISRVFVVSSYLSKELSSVEKNIDKTVDSFVSQARIALSET